MKRATPIRTKLAAQRIGESISTWRKIHGFTKTQLAQKANISRPTLDRVEQGDPAVSFTTILNLATMLGIMERVIEAFDPFETDYGRLRATEELLKKGRD